MSDDEGNQFELDKGLPDCVPTQVGSVKKGGYCILKGKPCKVTDYSTAKPGKHGSAKATIVGVDIFTGKKYEDGGPTASNILVPNVKKTEFEILDISADGFATLSLEDGSTKEDVKFGEGDDELRKQVQDYLDSDNGTVYVTLIQAVGQ